MKALSEIDLETTILKRAGRCDLKGLPVIIVFIPGFLTNL